jgi:hypothetical protein
MTNFCQFKGQQHKKNKKLKEEFLRPNLKYILLFFHNVNNHNIENLNKFPTT